MGCMSSKEAAPAAPAAGAKDMPAQEQALPVNPPSTPSTAATTPEASEAKPMPFAVMRNCHETIRAAYKDLDDDLEAGQMDAFGTHFKDMVRGMKFHNKMEEHGLFDYLDRHFESVAEKAGLQELHVKDDELRDAVAEAVDQKDMEKLKSTYEAWKTHNLEHLKAEEDVMMPKVQEIGKELEGDPQKIGEVLNQNILSRNFGNGREMAWFVSWNARTLAKHGSTSEDGFTAMRTFVWGCQYACTEEQWDTIWPSLKKDMNVYFPEMYEKLKEENDIEGPGKIATNADESDIWA